MSRPLLTSCQTAALNKCGGRQAGFGFFMEQGLGKTLTDLVDFQDMFAEGLVTRHAVIAPNSFKGGWLREIEKWGLNVEPHIYESGSRYNESFLKTRFTRPPFVVMNYEAAREISGKEFLAAFAAGRKAKLTLDESISIKDHASKQTKSIVGEIGKLFTVPRILSGRPQTQGPHDLWAQMRFIRLLNGMNPFVFRHTFCKMGGYMGKKVVGSQNEEYLAEMLDPHVFWAKKVDWTDLPPKVSTVREYKLSSEMQAHFDSMMHDFVLFLSTGDHVAVDAAITKYIKLAQIQAGFVIDEEGNVRELVDDKRNPRLQALRQFVDTELSGKLAVPYRHRHVFNMLEREFGDLKPAWIKGQMAPEEVEFQKRRFNEDPNCRAILLQTSAAKYGHTLLGGPEPQNRCTTMAFYENTYSLDDRSQIEDRIHRLGQLGDQCDYVDFVGTPLDEAMVNALQEKTSLFDAVFQHLQKTGLLH